MQEKCYNIGSGEGVLQMQKLQRRERTRERGHTEIQKNGRDTNGMTTIFDGFRLMQHRERRVNIQLRVFPYIFRFPPFFLALGLERKYTGKYWSKKVGMGTAFSLCNGRKTEDRKRDDAIQIRVKARQKRRQFAAYLQTEEPK